MNDKKQEIQNKQNEPYLELKLNHPLVQQPKTMMPEIYPSPYVPIPNPYYPYANNYAMPWQYTPNNVPIIKRYNISLGNANGDITKLANLYEDILPSVNNVSLNTFNTLKERMILHNYIRSIFVRTGDGEELRINGGKNKSGSEVINLLSHIKLLDMNPYHYSKQTENPYKTLPHNYVMYRSCYPIKLNSNNAVNCALSSVGMNVRIYLLSKTDDIINSTNLTNRHESDIFRELDYYQYIKEEIIKTNMSPNFILLHSWYMTENTGINFEKFKLFQSYADRNLKIEKLNLEKRNEIYIKYLIDQKFKDTTIIKTSDDLIKCKLNKFPITKKRDLTEAERKAVIDFEMQAEYKSGKLDKYFDSNKCLVMLTEAPTHNILNWATRTYSTTNGPVKKMIQHGYHDDKVWESIFFQILISMLIMFDKKIMFNEFKLQNNIFIRDLNNGDQNVGLWKYIYNKIEYYVPNYGYLALIDSNYANIIDKKSADNKLQYKIIGNILGDKNNKEIYKLCIEQMINIFNSNNFTTEFTNYGGVLPTEKLLENLGNINILLNDILKRYFIDISILDDTKETELKDEIHNLPFTLITKYNIFKILHTRIGSKLTEYETKFTSTTQITQDQINKGKLVVHKPNSVLHLFVLYINSIDDDKSKIITTNNPIFDMSDKDTISYKIDIVESSTIFDFYGNAKQYYEPGKQNNILETYLIS